VKGEVGFYFHDLCFPVTHMSETTNYYTFM